MKENFLGKEIFQWILKALFPPKCLVCKKEGSFLCSRHKRFEKAPKNEVSLIYLDEIFAATKYYSLPAKKVVEFFKFKGFKSLGAVMAQEMQTLVVQNDEIFKNAVLVPIPLHWTRRFWRGFNQAQILALAVQKKKPTFSVCVDLKRKRRTGQQARLKKKERAQNLKEAFVWKGQSCPEKIVLVDDVVASGETLESAAKILKKAGAKRVIGLVFARGGKN